MPGEAVHSQQPSAQRGMTLVPGGNRNSKNMPVDIDGREWSHGLCNCFSALETCMSITSLEIKKHFHYCLGVCATLCPCVVYGNNHERYNHLARYGTPERDTSCANTACFAHGILSLCGFSFFFQVRKTSSTRLMPEIHFISR